MKRIIAYLCIAALILVACNKDEDTSNNVGSDTPVDTTDTTYNYPSTAVVIYNAVTDFDGNSYDAVRIGDQVWMASNLRSSHYANGEEIPEATYASSTESYLCFPNGDVAFYGYLYNWPAVMHGEVSSGANPSGVQGVCPNGWHVPSDAEWFQLTDYLADHSEFVCNGTGENVAKALAADYGWHNCSGTGCEVGYDLSSNNATGFSALPAGAWLNGCYVGGIRTYFWTSTACLEMLSWVRCFDYDNANVSKGAEGNAHGLSVRCVRD